MLVALRIYVTLFGVHDADPQGLLVELGSAWPGYEYNGEVKFFTCVGMSVSERTFDFIVAQSN